MIKYLYDLVVYLTTNYSLLPDSFRARFSEKDLVNLRIGISDLFNASKDFDDYE